jgi:hypothetical protein
MCDGIADIHLGGNPYASVTDNDDHPLCRIGPEFHVDFARSIPRESVLQGIREQLTENQAARNGLIDISQEVIDMQMQSHALGLNIV